MQAADQANRTATDEGDQRILGEIRLVNEQLLISGLRFQALADELGQQLAFTTAINASLGDGVYAADEAGRVVFTNPAVERLLGWSPAELLGQDAHAMLHTQCAGDAALALSSCPLLEVVHTGSTFRNTSDAFRRRDGAPLPVAYTSAPVFEGGRIVGSVVTFSDESERQAFEQQREDFIEAVAHDLRSPLSVIKGTAQSLSGWSGNAVTADGSRLRRGLERIDATTTRMNLLLQEFLDLARLRAGQILVLDRQFTDLVALTRRAVEVRSADTGDHLTQFSSAVPRLIGEWDASRLERVIENLLSNAVKYSLPGGAVRVTLGAEANAQGEWAVLSVQDWGMGIPAADLPHIFERFHRGSNVTGRISGTGIGLEGARQIVAQHGGTITITSEEGSGTMVTVRLPLLLLGPEDSAL